MWNSDSLVFFLFRLAFTQLQCVSGKGFLMHRSTAAQPSLLLWTGVSDCLSLAFMLLTVMNFLFSWNGQNLDPQMGSKRPWWHCRDSFYGKGPPSWARFASYCAQICNCFLYQAHKCSLPVILGGRGRRRHTLLVERVVLSGFSLRGVPWLRAQGRQVTSVVGVHKARVGYSVCWVSAWSI